MTTNNRLRADSEIVKVYGSRGHPAGLYRVVAQTEHEFTLVHTNPPGEHFQQFKAHCFADEECRAYERDNLWPHKPQSTVIDFDAFEEWWGSSDGWRPLDGARAIAMRAWVAASRRKAAVLVSTTRRAIPIPEGWSLVTEGLIRRGDRLVSHFTGTWSGPIPNDLEVGACNFQAVIRRSV